MLVNHGYSVRVPPRLELVRCAEREPTAGQADGLLHGPPTGTPAGRAARRPSGETASRSANHITLVPPKPAVLETDDAADLLYIAGTLLPLLDSVRGDLHNAVADRNPAWTIAALRRLLAAGLVAKNRADSLGRRLA
jgi:hypothetical protein